MLSKSGYAKLSKADKAKLSKSLSRPKKASKSAPRRATKGTITRVTRSQEPWHKGLASSAGGLFGGAFGGPLGSKLGSAAGSLFSSITGVGDYKVRQNSIIGMGTDPPSFSSSGKGGTRSTVVSHREFITDISGSTAFTNREYPINPGMSTFTWLSQIAQNFEQYRLHGLVFEFKTTCATALSSSTNTAMGTVIMATEYNSINSGFTSKAQMENHEYCTSAIPSQSFYHAIECAPQNTSIPIMYVRTGAVPTSADQRMYDMGIFQLATVGMQASNIIGELWITYQVELFKPVLFGAVSADILVDHYKLSGATVSSGNLFGTVMPLVSVPTSSLGTTISSSNTIIFPNTLGGIPRSYFIHYSVKGGSVVVSQSIYAAGYGGAAFALLFQNDTQGGIATQPSNTTTITFDGIVAIPSGQALPYIIFGAGITMPVAPNVGDIFITEFNPYLLTKDVQYCQTSNGTTPKYSSINMSESKEEKKLEVVELDDDYIEYLKFKKLMLESKETHHVVEPPTPTKQASRK